MDRKLKFIFEISGFEVQKYSEVTSGHSDGNKIASREDNYKKKKTSHKTMLKKHITFSRT